MNSKLRKYTIEQLASTGFVLLDHKVAFKLRPDIWATPTNCMCDMTIWKEDVTALQRLGAMLFTAIGPHDVVVRGAARSMREIEKRIELCAGLAVMDAVTVETFSVKQKNQQPGVTVKPDNIAELKELAAMELPMHDCALRKKILRSRQELGARGLTISI